MGSASQVKVWYNVTVQNSSWPVKVKMSPENTARELMTAAIDMYVKDGRRPLLGSSDPASYELHYSQFNFESLEAEKKLKDLAGARNFYVSRAKSSAE